MTEEIIQIDSMMTDPDSLKMEIKTDCEMKLPDASETRHGDTINLDCDDSSIAYFSGVKMDEEDVLEVKVDESIMDVIDSGCPEVIDKAMTAVDKSDQNIGKDKMVVPVDTNLCAGPVDMSTWDVFNWYKYASKLIHWPLTAKDIKSVEAERNRLMWLKQRMCWNNQPLTKRFNQRFETVKAILAVNLEYLKKEVFLERMKRKKAKRKDDNMSNTAKKPVHKREFVERFITNDYSVPVALSELDKCKIELELAILKSRNPSNQLILRMNCLKGILLEKPFHENYNTNAEKVCSKTEGFAATGAPASIGEEEKLCPEINEIPAEWAKNEEFMKFTGFVESPGSEVHSEKCRERIVNNDSIAGSFSTAKRNDQIPVSVKPPITDSSLGNMVAHKKKIKNLPRVKLERINVQKYLNKSPYDLTEIDRCRINMELALLNIQRKECKRKKTIYHIQGVIDRLTSLLNYGRRCRNDSSIGKNVVENIDMSIYPVYPTHTGLSQYKLAECNQILPSKHTDIGASSAFGNQRTAVGNDKIRDSSSGRSRTKNLIKAADKPSTSRSRYGKDSSPCRFIGSNRRNCMIRPRDISKLQSKATDEMSRSKRAEDNTRSRCESRLDSKSRPISGRRDDYSSYKPNDAMCHTSMEAGNAYRRYGDYDRVQSAQQASNAMFTESRRLSCGGQSTSNHRAVSGEDYARFRRSSDADFSRSCDADFSRSFFEDGKNSGASYKEYSRRSITDTGVKTSDHYETYDPLHSRRKYSSSHEVAHSSFDITPRADDVENYSKLHRIPCAEMKPESLTMAIALACYPLDWLTETQSDEIQRCLLNLIASNSNKMQRPPQFIKSELDNGILIILCADSHSKSWLYDNFHHLRLSDNAQLRLGNACDISNSAVIFIKVPKSCHQMGTSSFLELLEKQNCNLNTGKWYVVGRTTNLDEQNMYVCIDWESFNWLRKNDFMAFCGMSQINFVLADTNPYGSI